MKTFFRVFRTIILAALSVAFGMTLGVVIGERIILARVDFDVASAASITSTALKQTFNQWGNLLPMRREDDASTCVAFNVMDQANAATWSKDQDGRCRIRDFLIQKFVRAVAADEKSSQAPPPSKSGE
jgi:hypothetical protein